MTHVEVEESWMLSARSTHVDVVSVDHNRPDVVLALIFLMDTAHTSKSPVNPRPLPINVRRHNCTKNVRQLQIFLHANLINSSCLCYAMFYRYTERVTKRGMSLHRVCH